MNRPNIAAGGCATRSRADGQGWQQLHSSDFNPSPQRCQGPQSRAFHLLPCLVHARHPEKAYWTRCTAHIYYSSLPAFLFFKQAWRNKFALGWEQFCLVWVRFNRVATKTFRKTVFNENKQMHNCRVSPQDCWHVSSPSFNSRNEKIKERERWQGNTVAIEARLPQTRPAEQTGAPHGGSRCPCQGPHTGSSTHTAPCDTHTGSCPPHHPPAPQGFTARFPPALPLLLPTRPAAGRATSQQAGSRENLYRYISSFHHISYQNQITHWGTRLQQGLDTSPPNWAQLLPAAVWWFSMDLILWGFFLQAAFSAFH